MGHDYCRADIYPESPIKFSQDKYLGLNEIQSHIQSFNMHS